jgi:retinol-binding protein 3
MKLFVYMLLIVLLSGSGQAQVTNEQKVQAIAELGKALKARYVYLDAAEKAARFLEQRLAGGAYGTSDPRAFGTAVTVDLQAVTKDAHLRFGYAEPEPTASQRTPEQEKTRRDAEQAAMRQANFGFARVEILAGNVGYLDFRRFMPPDAAGDTLVGTMAFLANADAVIIDLRNCTGGSAHMNPFFAAYFFSRPTSLYDMVFRGDDFVEHYWTLAWIPGKRLAAIPMYILTSPRTFSGAEAFAYRFQVLKRATIVGETTGGGANAGGILDIAPCFRVWMPMGRPVDPNTGSNWEGSGVIPDIKTAARSALVSAHLLALEKLRAQAALPAEQQRLDWALERAQAVANPVEPGVPELQRLAGTYGNARVWVEGGQLRFRRETEQTVLLTPLSTTVFASELSDPVRLEFIRDRRGRIIRLQVTRYDFNREELPRLK